MINPKNPEHLSRLDDSITWSLQELYYPKQNRVEAITDLVGCYYSENILTKKMPVNMQALAVAIYTRLLMAQSPRVIITTNRPELKPTAANLELAVNDIPDEIGLNETLQDMVLEALFSIGIVKVGLYSGGELFGHKQGRPFVDLVTFDDYFCDMSARDWKSLDYEGNDYWRDYEDIMDADWLMEGAKDDLKPDDLVLTGPIGERQASEVSVSGKPKLCRDKIWLRDVWLPKEKLLITYQVKTKKLLSIVEKDDDVPDSWPYIKLGYGKVPGNLLPLPPVSLWRDLNELANALYRKLGNQADSQKSVLLFQGGNDDSVAALKTARDVDGIQYSGIKPEKVDIGGINQPGLAFAMHIKDLCSYVAGNLDTLGGLSTQAGTVGQEKLLSQSANSQLSDMSEKTVSCVEDIFRLLTYYEWTDPTKKRKLKKNVPGSDLSVMVDWNQKAKKGKLDFYDLEIDTYSLQDNSPEVKLQRLKALVDSFIAPLAPALQQMGALPDTQKIIEDATKWIGLATDGPYVIFNEQSNQQGSTPLNITSGNNQGQPGGGGQSGTATAPGGSASVQQVLLGGNPGGASE